MPHVRRCILIAEDETITRLFLVQILQQAGYRILEACNGEEALHIAEQHGPAAIDLLITNLRMPKMGGFELVRSLQLHAPRLKVAVVTGSYSDEIPPELLAKSECILRKPILDTVLLGQVATLLTS